MKILTDTSKMTMHVLKNEPALKVSVALFIMHILYSNCNRHAMTIFQS